MIRTENKKFSCIYYIKIWYPLLFGISIFIILGFLSHYPLLLTFVSAGICIVSFFATLKYIFPELTDTKKGILAIFSKQALEQKSTYTINDIEQESPAIVLGSSGIYGIINGLGIVEALPSYAQSLSEKLKSHIINNSYAFLGIITLDLSNTFRLIGFLVTIIPFIHGAILTFSNKWYKHKITAKYRFDLAFLFFIVIFLHTSLFFFLALNITSFPFFVVLLWTIMLINTPWLAFQAFLTMKKLKRADVFLYGWIIINFNTLAFLSVFVVLPSSMFLNNANTSKDLIING